MNKKVLFFLIDMNVGGTEKSFLNLISHLPKSYKIDVLLLKKQGGFLKEIPDTVRVFEIDHALLIDRFINKGPKAYIFHLLTNFKIFKACYSLFNYIRWKLTGNFIYNYKSIDEYLPKFNVEYDIAIAYAGPHSFITYYVLEKVQAIKKIQWIHFDLSKISFDKNFANNMYGRFNEIRLVSEDVKNQFKKYLIKFDKNLIVQHNIVSADNIIKLSGEGQSYEDDFQGIRIVSVGRLSKEKGHELFVPVLKELINNKFDVKWYIVGDGNYRKTLLKMIKQNGLEDNIELLGTKINPYPYIKNADIFLQSSYYEGHSVTILEAKILNKPIITTNFSGLKDEIKNGITGLIVPISSEGLYQGIKQLLDNKSLQEKFIVNLQQENLDKTAIDKKITL